MAYSLCLKYIDERYYIHRKFTSGEYKTSHNQNFAMLFRTEGEAEKFRIANNIPEDYEPTFIPIRMSGSSIGNNSNRKMTVKEEKEEIAKEVKNAMPSFLKGD